MQAFWFSSEYDCTPYISIRNDYGYEVSLDGSSEDAIEFSCEEVAQKLESGEWDVLGCYKEEELNEY